MPLPATTGGGYAGITSPSPLSNGPQPHPQNMSMSLNHSGSYNQRVPLLPAPPTGFAPSSGGGPPGLPPPSGGGPPGLPPPSGGGPPGLSPIHLGAKRHYQDFVPSVVTPQQKKQSNKKKNKFWKKKQA